MPEPRSIELTVDKGGPFGAVVERLVSAAAARADLPVDRVMDALTVVDALVAASDAILLDGARSVELRVGEHSLEIILDGLTPGQADAVLAAADVPDLGNILSRTASAVEVVDSDSGSALVLALN